MGISGEQEFSAEIEAPIEVCYDTIIAFERYPEWFSNVDHAAVLTRHADGRGHRVEFEANTILKRIRYVLEYEHHGPSLLTWQSVDGDLDSVVGDYKLESLGKGLTRATCRQAVSVGFWVPGPMRRLVEQTTLRQAVLEFKTAAEALVAARPKGGRSRKA